MQQHVAGQPWPIFLEFMFKLVNEASAYPPRPLPAVQFMASEENRQRYWARSFAGWPRFGSVAPNAAHEGIARMQHSGA